MNPKRVLIVIGARPEAIKLFPVAEACRRRPDALDPLVALTGQHVELVEPLVEYFDLRPDFRGQAMRPGQSLAGLAARCLTWLDEIGDAARPDLLVAQGDTATTFAAATAAFLRRTPFLHVEAGLRTYRLDAPWPEEFHRRVATLAAAWHAAPTPAAAEHLRREGVPEDRIRVTGNTVVDALLWTRDRERRRDAAWNARHATLGAGPLVLVTGHRRENFGPPLAQVCLAIRRLAERFPAARFLFPVHLNPAAQQAAAVGLAGLPQATLLPPLDYPEFVWLLDRAALVLTDSGGVQEEAASLGRPTLILRDVTERPEAVASGCAQLVGTDSDRIVAAATAILAGPPATRVPPATSTPFGDGQAGERIADWLAEIAANSGNSTTDGERRA